MPEGFSNPNEKYKSISEAQNFDELYEALDKLGELTGSEKTGKSYSAEVLQSRIESVRNGVVYNADSVTRTGGLRDKVKELLKKEQEEREQ